MSTYKFTIIKRHIMDASDSSQFAPSAWSYADSTDEARSKLDIDVAIYLDDALKHTVTLTDSGATLQFDADVSVGDHTIAIKAPKSPIQQTNICVDQFLIGTDTCVASQYNFNNAVLGTTSTLRQMLSLNNAQPHEHAWWGHTEANDSSLNLVGLFYRPTIVSNHQSEWHMDFTKASNGTIWINNPGDVNDIMHDSTMQHTYYFVKTDDSASVDTAYDSYLSTERLNQEVGDSTYESTTTDFIEGYNWQGPGTYAIDSTNLVQQNDSIDISVEDANSVVVFSLTEYNELRKGLWYHRNYTVTPITVT